MSTPVKAVIQERLRAKVVKKEVHDSNSGSKSTSGGAKFHSNTQVSPTQHKHLHTPRLVSAKCFAFDNTKESFEQPLIVKINSAITIATTPCNKRKKEFDVPELNMKLVETMNAIQCPAAISPESRLAARVC